MKIHSIEKAFYFIDPAKTTAGDGSTVENASNNFPETVDEDKIYVVRRTEFDKTDATTYATFRSGSFSARSVVFMGMPKNTDPEWDWFDAETKTAWGSDAADYACVRVDCGYRESRDTRTTFTSCLNFRMTRVKFLAYNTSGDWNDPRFAFYFDNYPSYYIRDCYFANFDWSAINATNLPEIYRVPSGYFYGRNTSNTRQEYYKGYSFFMTDCTIEKYGNSDAFCFYGFHDIFLKNLEIYNTEGNNNSVFGFADGYRGCNATIDTANIYVLFNNHNEEDKAIPYVFNISRANHVKITNIHAERYTDSTILPYNNYVHANPVISVSIVGSGSEINNISINFPFMRLIRGCLIYVCQFNGFRDDYRAVPESAQYCKLSNIDITTAETPTGTFNEDIRTSQNMFDYSSDVGALYLTIDNSYAEYHNVSQAFLVQNITLNCNSGVALFARKAIIDLANSTIYGCVNLAFCTGKIKKISSWMCGYVLRDGMQNFLYIEEIFSNKNNPSYTYNANPAVVTDWASNILCGKCNIKFMPESYVNQDRNRAYECEYICTSEVTDGNYVVRNRLAKAQTWSISKDGSTTGCSLKLTNTVRYDERFPLRIGGEPFRGVKFAVPAGKKTLKFYCCVVGYNDPNEIKYSKHLMCKVTLPDGQVLYSDSGSWVDDDPNAWLDVDFNTNFVFELPINSSISGDGYIEYMFNWAQNEAATYLDPFPEIV